ncbi:MAG: ppiB 1 [Acidobacteria bacterium]|nr:ppiB 1 [Acidobacteriota bacterium]
MTIRSEGTAKGAPIAEKRWGLVLCVVGVLCGSMISSAQPAGPVIVVETTKGTFEFETYPADAPKTVAHIVDLVTRRFYDGQRIHRALPGFLVQWGDPRSRELSREADWGRGPDASSGHPIGASELRRNRRHTRGAVAVAHQGVPALADSQIFVTLANRPDLNNRYTVFGHITAGDDVPPRLERGDSIRRMYVKE